MISPSDIVDVEGLSKVLSCSTATIKKTWREYPHIFIGLGRTAKSARFIVDDVVSYLIERDYKNGISRSKNKKMGKGFKNHRMSKKKEKRIQNQERGKAMGKCQAGRDAEPESRTDPIDNFRSMFAVS
nr:hypothetical protein [Desulfobacula phenolica]